MKKLNNLTEKEFNKLKKMGYLWEFYPNAPEFWRDIKNNKEKLPIIKVGKITEHKDGSASYEIFYDDSFLSVVKDSLKLSKTPHQETNK